MTAPTPSRLEQAINVADLRRLARRRLPRIVFDYIEGGCEDEAALSRNEASFGAYCLLPRYLRGIASSDQSTTLFGRRYASPFGIAPTGLAALYRPGADVLLAQAAAAADIPFIQSGASTASIETIAAAAPAHAWYQLYQPKDPAIAEDLLRRAQDAGITTLVLTVDAQGGANQERNIRNGFTQPLRMRPAVMLEALCHPFWLAEYMRTGMPVFEDWRRYAGNTDAHGIAGFVASQGRALQSWADVDRFRRLWPGAFVIKGILHPDDARQAASAGVDGIIVSNHGGRKLDRAPAPLHMLPDIVAAVGDRVTIMLDGGIRRGADIATALCQGAQFCFIGRATLYGVVAGGGAGAAHAIGLLRRELGLLLAQLGCTDVAGLDAALLAPATPSRG